MEKRLAHEDVCANESHWNALSILKNVLHVEEQILIAMDVAATLADAGVAHVVHVTNCDAALAVLADQEIDAAILDVTAAGVGTDRVARRLRIAGIPYVLYTGAATIPDQLRGSDSILRKPVDGEKLIAAMRRTLGLTPHEGGVAGGRESPQCVRGCQERPI